MYKVSYTMFYTLEVMIKLLGNFSGLFAAPSCFNIGASLEIDCRRTDLGRGSTSSFSVYFLDLDLCDAFDFLLSLRDLREPSSVSFKKGTSPL